MQPSSPLFSPSRRRFLTGRSGSVRQTARPPWSADEADFHALCSRCDACLDACPENILQRDAAGFPRVDFSVGGCTFCGDCAEACEPKALARTHADAPWMLRASINDDCLARRQVVCRTCGERCEAGAIRFQPKAGGVATPQLDIATCTGCGFCVSDCPTRAIHITQPLAEAA